jgi:hypothetical protein
MKRVKDLRRRIPMKVKLEAALLQLGLDPKTAECDHDPALGRRVINEDGTDFVPPQHDPRYLRWREKQQHRVKTSGRKGTSKLSIGMGDIQEIKKADRILKEQEKFRSRLLAKDPRPRSAGAPSETSTKRPTKSWPKRAFERPSSKSRKPSRPVAGRPKQPRLSPRR